MARPAHTKPTGKGKLPNGKKHLNASLPQQLVFDFNAVAQRQGHGRRDALIEDILRAFLEKVDPNAPSLRQSPSSAFVKHLSVTRFSRQKTKAFAQNLEEQEAIRLAREFAEEILSATSNFITRKPARRAAKVLQARKKRA
jgi:metal-responsive CopG/Arc/MetJ family transcriptional regulator